MYPAVSQPDRGIARRAPIGPDRTRVRGHRGHGQGGGRRLAALTRGADVIDRSALDASRPLQRETWAGAVDCVGGETLAAVLASLRYGAAVAASGNTGGVAVPTTVFPFILRAVSLLGIDSVQCPIERRRAVWARLADDLRPSSLDALGTDEVGLAEVPAALARILGGGARGRTLVRVS